MTTSTPISREESSVIGTDSESATATNVNNVIYREFNVASPETLPNTSPIEDLVAEFEADADMVTRMAQARRNLSATLYNDEAHSFSALRLAAGLSQVQLAERAETTQSHIARIEAGKNDPSTEMVVRIARALGVDEALVFRAIRYQIDTRGQPSS